MGLYQDQRHYKNHAQVNPQTDTRPALDSNGVDRPLLLLLFQSQSSTKDRPTMPGITAAMPISARRPINAAPPSAIDTMTAKIISDVCGRIDPPQT
jgi:hypothetical protein